MIQVTGLCHRFGSRPVLSDLTLSVPPGQVTLLVGANGAGKTTLLRAIAGLLHPDSGRVAVAGNDVATARFAALSALAYLPQAPRFHTRLTTQQVLRFYAGLRGAGAVEVSAALAAWGLEEHVHALTCELSGGLRQRLALAVFSLAHPSVLVLDEPGLSLDPQWRNECQQYLARRAAAGATVLVATHLVGEWDDRVDACVLLENGSVSGWLPAGRAREFFATGSMQHD